MSLCIPYCGLKPHEAEVVERCMVNYNHQPSDLQERVAQIAYQILEQIKHLFNASDWDKAQEVLTLRAEECTPGVVKLFLGRKSFEKAGSATLSTLVWVHRQESKLTPRDIQIMKIALIFAIQILIKN